MTEPVTTPPRSDLRDLVGPVWRRKLLVLAIVIMSTTATYSLSSRQDKRYRSQTQVFVSASSVNVLVNGPSGGTDRDTQDQAQLIRSRSVAEAVIRKLRLREEPTKLLRTVTALPSTGSNFVSVSAERASGTEAAAVANAFVTEYIAYRGLQLIRDVDPAIRDARKQLADLPRGPSVAQQRQDLRETIRELQSARNLGPTQVRQTDLATAPSRPFSPRPKRDAGFGFVIALTLALALAFVLERFDRRIMRPEEVSATYDVPLLSVIPHTERPTIMHESTAAVPDVLREPFRALRTSLQFASLDKPVNTLAVTSAIPGEGKSTVVRNLALTYHEWGLNVAVVEADLRRPTLSRVFGAEPTDIGLTSVLTGDVALDDALIEIEVDYTGLEYLDKVRARGPAGPSGAPTAPAAGIKLVLLPSGETPPNPQAVLATEATRQVIEQLGARFDIVLIDTAPLLAVSDSVPLLSQSDGIVIVARIGLTDRGSAERVIAAARRVPKAEILGVVANDVHPEIGGGYGYGYGYSDGAKTKT